MKLFKMTAAALFVCAIGLTTFAQETPAGKKFAENFWKAIAEERTYGAKSALEALKRREPNFDASKMEKALADLEAKGKTKTADSNATDAKEPSNTTPSQTDTKTTVVDSSSAKSKDKTRRDSSQGGAITKNDVGHALETLFEHYFEMAGSPTEAKLNARIESSRENVDRILAFERASIQRELDKALRVVQNEMTFNDRENAKLVKAVNEAEEGDNAEANYAYLLFRQAYWDNARRIFPDERDVKAAYDSVANAVASLGTKEARAAKAGNKLAAKIDAERMSKSTVRDAKIEQWFKDTFVATMAREGNDVTFLKVIVIWPEFTIKRNTITGIITGRSRGADIAFKTKDGKCMHGVYSMNQEYNGSTYGIGQLRTDAVLYEMRCENVK